MVANFVDFGAIRKGGTVVDPWPLDGRCSVDLDSPACAEAKVETVIAADNGWVVSVSANSATGQGLRVGVCCYCYDREDKGIQKNEMHLEGGVVSLLLDTRLIL